MTKGNRKFTLFLCDAQGGLIYSFMIDPKGRSKSRTSKLLPKGEVCFPMSFNISVMGDKGSGKTTLIDHLNFVSRHIE